MKRVLITGANGFVGRHLINGFSKVEDVQTIVPNRPFDVRDVSMVDAMIERSNPDVVIHLAAQSSVPNAIANPALTLEINVNGTLNVLNGLKKAGFRGRLLYVSSADVYGVVPPENLPVDESIVPSPRNPYAASKLCAEILCQQWSRVEAAEIVVVRPFNHVGPGQSDAFVLSSLASQVAAIEAGIVEPIINVGDIDVTRDFSDVRDIASAYITLATSDMKNDFYVVGSGKERSVRSILETMCSIANIHPQIVVESSRLRKSEQRRMVANPRRIQMDHAWEPTIEFEQTLLDILDEARGKLK